MNLPASAMKPVTAALMPGRQGNLQAGYGSKTVPFLEMVRIG
jgi:hypothetical protein